MFVELPGVVSGQPSTGTPMNNPDNEDDV